MTSHPLLALGGVLCAALWAPAAARTHATAAAHSFGLRHADISVRGTSKRSLFGGSSHLTVMHVSDVHISLNDDDPPRTTRMYRAFEHTTDKVTGAPTSSSAEFVRLMEMACAKNVDLIALGGDIVNFPSNETVAWVVQQLRGAGCGIPFVYTAGNHDWHEEGFRAAPRYDSQRVQHLETTLRPLFANSLIPNGQLYGHTHLKGVDILVFDNSNHQINEEQLRFAKQHLGPHSGRQRPPMLLLLHMPLALPQVRLPPKLACGHPDWGAATDENWELEGRPSWPLEGNPPSTRAFIELVQQSAAPNGPIVALLTGHVHRDFSVPAGQEKVPLAANHTALACDTRHRGCALRAGTEVFEASGAVGSAGTLLEAEGAVQYTTLDGAEGGYRLLTIRHTVNGDHRLV